MNKTRNRINWIRVIRSISLALVLLFLLSYATYSWMKRDWKPKIHQENVRIVAGSSLTFIFQDDEIDDIPINTLLGMNEFTFKSVSNPTGKSEHFFNLNYGTQGEIYDTFNHLGYEDIVAEYDVYENRYTALGRSCGYIELTFKIASATEGEVFDKDIYLAGSFIKGVDEETNVLNAKAAKAIRISITAHSTETQPEITTVFSKGATEDATTATHKAITKYYIADADRYAADTAPRYNRDGESPTLATTISNRYLSEPIPLTESSTIKTFKSFEEEPLFTLEKGTQRSITVRIWLEGEDENCTNDIADSALDVLLQFTAKDVK